MGPATPPATDEASPPCSDSHLNLVRQLGEIRHLYLEISGRDRRDTPRHHRWSLTSPLCGSRPLVVSLGFGPVSAALHRTPASPSTLRSVNEPQHAVGVCAASRSATAVSLHIDGIDERANRQLPCGFAMRWLHMDKVGRNGQHQRGLRKFIVDAGLQRAPCLLYTSPSPRDATLSRMPSSA